MNALDEEGEGQVWAKPHPRRGQGVGVGEQKARVGEAGMVSWDRGIQGHICQEIKEFNLYCRSNGKPLCVYNSGVTSSAL